MNKTPLNTNRGLKSIAKREWEAKQAANKAAIVQKNKAVMAAMVRGIK